MSATQLNTIRIGTRQSLLARMQTDLVVSALQVAHPGLKIDVLPLSTSGDRIQDRPLHEIGGKGLFTRELEVALIDRSIDAAVHSLKDLPVTMPLVDASELTIAAILKREDPRDVLVTSNGLSLDSLQSGASIGTCSLRRKCQMLETRPDLRIEFIRGNIDTRLKHLRDKRFDGIVLALAGLLRAGLFDKSTMHLFDETQMLPAAGQGALAVQCRKDDELTRAVLQKVDDSQTRLCCEAEREVVRLLDGDCHSPIAALAKDEADAFRIRAKVGKAGGELPIISAEDSSPARVVAELVKLGARELLHSADSSKKGSPTCDLSAE